MENKINIAMTKTTHSNPTNGLHVRLYVMADQSIDVSLVVIVFLYLS